ncbi:hypothetical protein [Parasitella parasitica]|uniref:5-formyltetrahydrofolate cyclo-ligase n=1 Tax=Parasitella parasitica TaxID=35722 RepID=A0A0B7ND62_9FUNG|nr:hypothetical protein [Parasitella parasitica]
MNKAIVELKKQLRKDMAERLRLLGATELKEQSKFSPAKSVQKKLQEMDVFQAINDIEDFRSLPMNKWNIPEPPLDQPRADAIDDNYGNGLDLILVPGVAFDKAKNRIGHGKGYYDRYIKKCNIWADEHGIDRPKTIALSLNEQILEVGAIPLEETDEKLDFILTPSDTF